MACAAAEYEVPWKGENNNQQPHFNDIWPDADDKNVIPQVDSGNPTLGTAQDPWHGLVVRGNLLWSLIFSWYGYDRVLLGFDTVPSITQIKARNAMQQHDTEAELSVLQLDQKNEEEAFIYFEGEIGDEKSISEVDGTTTIIGPKARLNNQQYGWKRGPMLKVFVEGYEEADLYVQTYEQLKPQQQ